METYVFIDESGDLGEEGSKYLVITAIWIEDIIHFERLIKNMRRYKFKKELKKAHEIKANKSSGHLIEHVLKEFLKMPNVHAQSIILDKSKLYSNYLKGDKNKLYNYIAGKLSTVSIESKNLILRVDKSKTTRGLREDFDKYMKKKFEEIRWGRTIDIHHSYSHAWPGLQIADIISWSVFRKFEYNDDYYFKIIEKQISIDVVWK